MHDDDDPRSPDEMAKLGMVVPFGNRRTVKPIENGKPEPPTLTEELIARMRPGSDDEFDESMAPDRHVFMRDEEGLFPVYEGSTVAGLARAGKTQAVVSIAGSMRLGLCVGGLPPSEPGLATLIVTAEDNRIQILRKVNAVAYAAEEVRKGDGAKVRSGVVVLDLDDDVLADARALVRVEERQPRMGRLVNALVTAIGTVEERRRERFGMVMFETASALNDSDESNSALRVLALAMRRVARQCELATVISHHLSQAAIQNVRDLNLSFADIRGGTTLPNNLRQCCVLVGLGSNSEPYSATDLRTLLRQVIDDDAPQNERGEPVAVLVPLDSSKGARPPPVYFRRYRTPCGPALVPIPTPYVLEGLSWRRQLERLRGMRTEVREDAKSSQNSADIADVVAAVAVLEREGRQPTVNAVSKRLGHGADWAASRLARAQATGRLRATQEPVPRQTGVNLVYRSVNASAGEASPEASP